MTSIEKSKKKDAIYKNKEWLYEQYWKKKKSARKLGTESGVSVVTILYWMKKFDIKRRKNPKAKKLSRVRCLCDNLVRNEWYYCPKCGRKIRRLRMIKNHNDTWIVD